MWIFTSFGFFSVVQKANTPCLTVRSRIRGDLDRLRQAYMPELTPTTETSQSDYRLRASIAHDEFARGVGKIVSDLHYPNFKAEVGKVLGDERAHLYLKVWEVLRQLQAPEEPGAAPKRAVSRPGLKMAYGGVVLNREGQVLLREVKNHFDGYVWTFPKGRPDRGESPEAAARREVLEETGIEARTEAQIPGAFAGGTTETVYFLMSMVSDARHFDDETAAIRWALPDEARKLIGQTTNAKGQSRDLAVLDSAVELWRRSVRSKLQ